MEGLINSYDRGPLIGGVPRESGPHFMGGYNIVFVCGVGDQCPVQSWSGGVPKEIKVALYCCSNIKFNDLLEDDERFHIRTSDNNAGFSFNRCHREDLKQYLCMSNKHI